MASPASESPNQEDTAAGAPPAYQANDSGNRTTQDDKPANVDITAAFAQLSLGKRPRDPDVDTCLAHLKLLYAFQTLKDDVGYTNGLWGLWDFMADAPELGPDELPSAPADGRSSTGKARLIDEKAAKRELSKLREKRWAIFVARAVDRYQAWWNAFPLSMLKESDMVQGSGARYHVFVDESSYTPWTEDMLPPLDVLMVWHAHMLNPRSYLEDTMRSGLSAFWATGMPWHLVAPAIDTDFNYSLSDNAKASFVQATGRNWDNAADSLNKNLLCPACQANLEIPWTTCGRDQAGNEAPPPSLVGDGFGDGEFRWACQYCAVQIDHKLLSVAKFIADAKNLVVNNIPMPGTILEPITGIPQALPASSSQEAFSRNFPNRLVRKKLIVQISDLIKPGMTVNPTMETIKTLISPMLSDNKALREINGISYTRGRTRTGLISLRKMMSRYWDNSGPFALELGGAVMRQGIFTAKMFQIDWLHSPNAHNTMARLVTKYQRFIGIMRDSPLKTCVPTLDIDLAWHTHQLAPTKYYHYTTQTTFKFVDHDDKIDDDTLSEAFDWTTKAYQTKYNEVYSECTCWYCETVRSNNTSSLMSKLGMSIQGRITQDFHKSGRAQMCPPDKSAHLSAHNAVHVPANGNSLTDRLRKTVRERQRRQLELDYQKACRRAEKNGRKLPPRDEYYNHWGYSYYMYSPFMYPMYFSPGVYYGGVDPGALGGANGWGSCITGACAGGVAAGACGGPGGCGTNAGGCGSGGGGGGCGSGGGGGGCGGGGGDSGGNGGGGCGGGGCGGGGCGGG